MTYQQMPAPSGKMVVPSGSLGPEYCPTNKVSPSCQLYEVLLKTTSRPITEVNTAAVSAWPTTDNILASLSEAITTFGSHRFNSIFACTIDAGNILSEKELEIINLIMIFRLYHDGLKR